MSKLFARSLLVLFLLFGLLFAVGAAVLYYCDLPVSWGIGFALFMAGLQYALGPYLIELVLKIEWVGPLGISPEFAEFYADLCKKQGINTPRFGIIEDGNPNAFTYGHTKRDARVVVTRGLVEMLDTEELHAVVTHEIGHVRHNDFIVMTVASVVPMILYMLYITTRQKRREAGPVMLVAIGAYVAYIVSQYVVLLLSRVREYFADEEAARTAPNANSISTALIKIAYGLARIPQEEKSDKKDGSKKSKQPDNRGKLVGTLGISNLSAAHAVALGGTTTSGEFSPELMTRAMQWDLRNPWAIFFELQSTHPLVARRVRAASQIASDRNQSPLFAHDPVCIDSYWGAFARDIFFALLPWLGIAAGLALSWSKLTSDIPHGLLNLFLAIPNFRYALFLGGLGWLARLAYSYKREFKKSSIADLVGEVEVSHINCIPVELEGKVIGRGIPGLLWSKDLVMQDSTGFITLVYRQPLGILETLFGLIKADALVDKEVTVRGWYRRGPIPYLELKEAIFATGERARCHYQAFLWAMAVIATTVGGYFMAV